MKVRKLTIAILAAMTLAFVPNTEHFTLELHTDEASVFEHYPPTSKYEFLALRQEIPQLVVEEDVEVEVLSSPELEQPQPEEPAPEPAPTSGTEGIPEHWLELARCESGNWVNGGESFTGPIRWNWGAPGMQIPPWGTNVHEGALQWAPSTWDWIAPLALGNNYPRRAYEASLEQEITVGEYLVQMEQNEGRGGYNPWPTCAGMIGLPK